MNGETSVFGGIMLVLSLFGVMVFLSGAQQVFGFQINWAAVFGWAQMIAGLVIAVSFGTFACLLIKEG